MSILRRLRTWWQCTTREAEAPFDGDAQAWMASLVFHLVLLVAVGVISVRPNPRQTPLTLRSSMPATDDEDVEPLREFRFAIDRPEEVGADSLNGSTIALAAAPEISEVFQMPPMEVRAPEAGPSLFDDAVRVASAPNFSKTRLVRGIAAVGTTGAAGAIDRITHEILLSLEERRTLVVWLFDQSGSLAQRRQEIRDRFDRIYQELGIIEQSGSHAFQQHRDRPLLTSIVAFGQDVSFRTKNPTDRLDRIKQAVTDIELDDSGVECVFTAVQTAAEKFRVLRRIDRDTREPSRNVMFVIVTDEAGDDQERLDHVVTLCRRLEMPVYVIGVPAPFGREETWVKWVDPDPRFDQTPRWGPVHQGPESLRPERVKIRFSRHRQPEAPIDSGFGPFALTRLCFETGGIYFAVHPNRRVGRRVMRHETEDFAAHFEYFFDPRVMRTYRPDYVSAAEYERRLTMNPSRATLVQAAEMSWIAPMATPRTRFVKTDDASLSSALTESQKRAAKLQPSIERLYQTIKRGESDRDNERSPRWQAGYDLAAGRIMAIKVRTETYNAMLAQAKRGMTFQQPGNNTWLLRPDDQIDVGSHLDNLADKARMYLNRVKDEHPDTPWALLAQQELREPLGWRWTETFTDLNPRRDANPGRASNPPPSDDRKRMLPRPKPKRPVPKL